MEKLFIVRAESVEDAAKRVKEVTVKDEDFGIVDALIADEKEAIDGYQKAIDDPKTNKKRIPMYNKIIDQEKQHIAMLEASKEND